MKRQTATALAVCFAALLSGTEAISQEALVLTPELLPNRNVALEIRKKLRKRISVDYEEKLLRHVMIDLEKQLDVPIVIEEQRLEDVQIDPNAERITLRLEMIRGKAVLDRVLGGLNLTWIIRHESVRITTMAIENEILETRSYDVADVLAWMNRQGIGQQRDRFGGFGPPIWLHNGFSGKAHLTRIARPTAEDRLIEFVQRLTHGKWEDTDANGGLVTLLNGILVVNQTRRTHEEIHQLLSRMREVEVNSRPGHAWVVPTDGVGESSNHQVYAKLKKTVEVEFVAMRFDEVCEFLADRSGIRIDLHWKDLDDIGLPPDEGITMPRRRASVRAVLDDVLDDFGLTAAVRDGGLLVVSVDSERVQFHPVILDARDLVSAGLRPDEIERVIRDQSRIGWDRGETVSTIGGFVFVMQSPPGHREVARTLATLRRRLPRAADQPAPKRVEQTVSVKFYRIPEEADPAAVRQAVLDFVFPDEWRAHQGTLRVIGRTLIVEHRPAVHDAIGRLLEELFDQDKPKASPAPPVPSE